VTSEQLRELTTEAHAVSAAGDADAANDVLARLAEIGDPEFEAFGLDDLKLVMQAASVLGQVGDTWSIGNLFARSINAMRKFDVAAAEYITPLYNLRAAYVVSGDSDEANRLLGHIVDAARHSDIVSVDAIQALNELLPGFENAGYSEAAATLYRPIYETVVANAQLDWHTKAEAAARYGRLELADGRPADAVKTYEKTLHLLDAADSEPGAADSEPDAAYARMMLWYLTAEAHSRGGSPDAAERAYEIASSIAEGSDDPDSQEAGVIYHNLAGFWFVNKRRDRYPDGVALTRRSLAIAERLGARDTSDYAGRLGQLANLHAELGETAAAQRYFDDCFATFATAQDTDPADVADYRDDEGKFRLWSGQADRAAASFSTAREIRGAIAGFPPDKLADSYGWLGVAHFEHGDFSSASEAFREAIQLRLDQMDPDAHAGGPR